MRSYSSRPDNENSALNKAFQALSLPGPHELVLCKWCKMPGSALGCWLTASLLLPQHQCFLAQLWLLWVSSNQAIPGHIWETAWPGPLPKAGNVAALFWKMFKFNKLITASISMNKTGTG